MKKQRLRRLLALAIFDSLASHKITLPNVKRYVTSDLLTHYTIRRETKISDVDIRVAIDMCAKALQPVWNEDEKRFQSKPASFRFAPRSSPMGLAREKYFLETPLADLL